MMIHNFVIFEGGDGSGTTTQLSLLRDRLELERARGERPMPNFSFGFEPTDGPIGRLIRQALRGETRLRPENVARLFAADRGEHLYAEDGVLARAERGELVVSDRYVPSSLVYQGLACDEELPALLNAAFPKPELLLFFDVDPRIALERIHARPNPDEFERLDFQLKVRDRYERILAEYSADGTALVRIDAEKSVEEVAEQVWSAITKLPIFGR
jgi:dTMP kinase